MQSFVKACPFFIVFLGLSTACSAVNGLKSSNESKPLAKNTGTSTNANANTNTAVGPEAEPGVGKDPTAETQKIADLSTEEAAVLNQFCVRAAKTKGVQGELSGYFSKFCKDGQATSILAKELRKVAYDGTGQPLLKQVEPWSEDQAAGTTTGYLALGIKLPISIEDHFNKVGPKAGDEATIAEVLTASGGMVEIASVLESFQKEGEYHIRGWATEQRVGRKAAALPITLYTHTVNRADQYELEKGSAYLYTSYVTESKELIENFDIFTAGIKLGDDSYLLTLAKVTLKNQGFHSVAMQAIQTAAVDLVKQMYNAAALEK